jgi:hypothetical protein
MHHIYFLFLLSCFLAISLISCSSSNKKNDNPSSAARTYQSSSGVPDGNNPKSELKDASKHAEQLDLSVHLNVDSYLTISCQNTGEFECYSSDKKTTFSMHVLASSDVARKDDGVPVATIQDKKGNIEIMRAFFIKNARNDADLFLTIGDFDGSLSSSDVHILKLVYSKGFSEDLASSYYQDILGQSIIIKIKSGDNDVIFVKVTDTLQL